MKINLLLNQPNDVRSGYFNIDPFVNKTTEMKNYKQGSPTNLDNFVCNNEATELVAHDILNTFPAHQVDDVINHWISKLAHRGQLIISVPDAREISRGILAGTISIEDANILLYGDYSGDDNIKRSLFLLSQVADVLTKKGLKILSKKTANLRAVVVAERQ